MEPQAQPTARSGQGRAALAPEPSAPGVRGFGPQPTGPRRLGVWAGAQPGPAPHSPSPLSRPPAPAAAALGAGSAAPASPTPAAALPGALAASWPRPPRPGSRAGGARGGARSESHGWGGRVAPPSSQRRAGPAPWPRRAWTLPRTSAPRRALRLRGLGSPLRRERRAESRAETRAGKDAPEDGDQGWVGARGSPSPPSGRRRRLAPLPHTARRGGACAPSGAADAPGQARFVLSLWLNYLLVVAVGREVP